MTAGIPIGGHAARRDGSANCLLPVPTGVTGYDAVLFDSDGVLVDPPARETKAEAVRAAFRAVEADPDREHVRAVVDGVTVEDLREICSACGLDVDAFWAARERCDARSQREAFAAGDRDRYDDVDALADVDAVRAVVSNNHHSTVEYVLDRFDLHSLFDTYRGRERSVESLRLKKPDPHYLRETLDDLGIDAGGALYVGDRGSDVVAARRAGVDSVFLRRPHCADATLSATPTYEASDLWEVARLSDGRE